MYDCLDDTDELHSEADFWCGTSVDDRFFCDEHLCKERFSCGDGVCVDGYRRYPFQKQIVQKGFACSTLRHVVHMCELWYDFPMWTLPDGRCWPFLNLYQEEVNKYNAEEYCLYLVKCALSGGYEAQCPCGGINHTDTCVSLIRSICPTPEIEYPRRNFLRPYIHAIYFRNRTDWRVDKTPDVFTIHGSVRCRGYQASIPISNRLELPYGLNIPFNLDLMIRTQFEYYICQSSLAVRNESLTALHTHTTCWSTDDLRLNKYAFNDICNKSRDCISDYRAQDGFWDCGEGEDDTYGWQPVTISCPPHLRKYRLMCNDKCLLVKRIGDGLSHCSNHYDEFFLGVGRRIQELTCQRHNNRGCQALRHYLTAVEKGQTT